MQALQQRLLPLEKLQHFEEQADKHSGGHQQNASQAEIKDLVSDLLQLLRLYCCSFRRSLRHATKKLHGQMKQARAPKGEVSWGDSVDSMENVLSIVIKLVENTSNAVRAMEVVRLQLDFYLIDLGKREIAFSATRLLLLLPLQGLKSVLVDTLSQCVSKVNDLSTFK